MGVLKYIEDGNTVVSRILSERLRGKVACNVHFLRVTRNSFEQDELPVRESLSIKEMWSKHLQCVSLSIKD